MLDKAGRGAAHFLGGSIAAAVVVMVAVPSSAQEPAPSGSVRSLDANRGTYVRTLATAMVGDGLRFNNPYRLRTELGDGGESLSRTPMYLDWGLGMVFGPPDGLQHGGAVKLSLGLEGVDQSTLTPSYLAVYRGPHPVLIAGRLGIPILIAPDPNVGGELAATVAYFFSAGVGLSAELAFDLFYGAATREARYTAIPILSGQIGVMVDYEILP